MDLRNTIRPSSMMTTVFSLTRELLYGPRLRSLRVMRYSPSAGKLCLNLMPPRVPGGGGSSGFWLCRFGQLWYFVLETRGLGLPTAS